MTADKRVYREIALDLAAKINSGQYPDRSLLPSERELVKQYDASRTSVREALLSLQSSGLISLRNRARAQVTRLGNSAFFDQLGGTAQTLLAQPGGMADFQEARMLFECGLARHAARHASPKEVGKLAVALANNKKALGDPEEFARTDLEFHNVLADIPGNPIFSALNTALSEWLVEQRHVGIRAPVRGAAKRACDGHEEIYEAIAAHDAEAAERAMAAHLRTVSELYWTTIASGGQPTAA